MKVNLYAVYDRASGVYDGPIPGHSDGAMIRNFSDMACNAEHQIGKHPEDYTLFKVGTWNDGTGELVDVISEKLINGGEAIAASRNIEPGSLEGADILKVGGSA